MSTWAALLIFPLMLTTVLGQANIDYFCPADLDCLCATLNMTTSLVQLVCRPMIMSSWVYPWTLIPTALTTWLTFECQWPRDGFLEGRDFQHLSGLTDLRFDSCQLPAIPDETFYGLNNLDILVMEGIGAPDMNATFLDPIRNVEKISMASNRFRHLPEYCFCGKHRLTFLNISNNFFSDFNAIGIDFYGNSTCLPALEEIYISNNYLGTKLPSLYKSMPNIGWFVAANNGITSLSSDVFHNLTGLISVDLSHNYISGLPEGTFLNSPNLKYVVMESISLRSISPTFFQNVGKLEILKLNGNHLTDVDMENLGLSSLSNVYWIEVNRNRLTSLTPSMLQGYPHLLYLDVSNNFIKTISEATFNNTNNLQYLFLQRNNLQRVSDNVFHRLRNLLMLDISQNDLRHIGDESLSMSPMVTQLNMSSNKLTQFPITIRHLYQLQNLDLSNNNILELPEPFMVPLENLLGMSMKNNSLTVITNMGFSWAPNLQLLNLAINKITSLHPASFTRNQNLQILSLESNNIASLQAFLLPLNRLAKLYMAHNDVTMLSSELLPSSLEYIDISNNLLSDLQPLTFLRLDSLDVVNLSHNQLRSFPREALYVSSAPDLTPQMRLKANWLNCTCEMFWLRTIQGSHSQYPRYPEIMDYDFIYCNPANLISRYRSLTEIRDDQFVCDYQESCVPSQCHCCGQLQCPCVCETTCYKCPENCTCYETADTYFSFVDCRNRNLTNVPTALDPDTTVAYFDGNTFSFISSYTFSNYSNLTKLYLNSSGISYIEQYAFENLFNLRELYLHSNELECILFDTFVGLVGMDIMSLSDNKLRDIANGTLSTMTYLTELDLSGNLFTSLPYDIIRNELGLKSIRLSSNPWACDCDVGPNLKEWVVVNANIVTDSDAMLCHLPRDSYASNYTDNVIIGDYLPSTNNYSHGKQTNAFPIRTILDDKHRGIQLELAQPQELDSCPPITEIWHPTGALVGETFNYCSAKPIELGIDSNKALQSALISLGIVLLVVGTLTLIMFNSREIVKVWLFTHYGLRFHKPKEEAYKDYDAFVSYSSQDEEFVSMQLAPKLESGNAPYKLLLHHRDWIVGASITESIIESVESSKRIILVLSENYVKSEWCRYEFKTAHHNVMKEHKNRIVVILLGDKLPKGMDKELKLYTKTTTYLRHDDPWFWDKLKYFLPDPVSQENCVHIAA